jgi:hypothetical protein
MKTRSLRLVILALAIAAPAWCAAPNAPAAFTTLNQPCRSMGAASGWNEAAGHHFKSDLGRLRADGNRGPR